MLLWLALSFNIFHPKTAFSYNYHQGPCENPHELNTATEGNCQRAVQYYFYRLHSVFLPPEEIFPDKHWESDTFIAREEQPQPHILEPEDVLYAESICSKNGKPLRRDPSVFQTEFEYLTRLHMAVHIIADNRKQMEALFLPDVPRGQQLVWHANYVDGKCSAWTLEQFQKYYRIIAVRRIVPHILSSPNVALPYYHQPKHPHNLERLPQNPYPIFTRKG